MKKLHLNLILLSFAIISVVSCKKELNLNPVSSISTSSFWKTENDATGALYGMYARFRSVTATNLFLWGEARSQDMKQSVGNDYSHMRIFTNTLDPTDAGPDWSTLYTVVDDANLIIANVPKIDFNSEKNKNRIIAEAYTMRAFCYFVMVRTWGPVPIVTEPTQSYDPSKIYKERSAEKDVFALIKQDIDSASALFPDNSFTAGRDRWSKPALNALKGNVYLWTGKKLNGGTSDFQTALDAFNQVDASDVALLSNFKSIFDYNNKGNKEIIMASNFTLHETGGTFMVDMGTGRLPNDVRPSTVDSLGLQGGDSYWTLTDSTRALFSMDDQRRSASYIEVDTKDASTGDYTSLYEVVQQKFPGIIDAGQRYFLNDVIIYRYGGVLLLKAETENALGMDPSDAINEVRKRAYGDKYPDHVFVSGTKEYNDSVILNERLRELLYEGKYWWDLLRNDKVTARVPYFQQNPSETYRYLWPLSLNILSLEPKATQNPGY